jgi:hypothetical protein
MAGLWRTTNRVAVPILVAGSLVAAAPALATSRSPVAGVGVGQSRATAEAAISGRLYQETFTLRSRARWFAVRVAPDSGPTRPGRPAANPATAVVQVALSSGSASCDISAALLTRASKRLTRGVVAGRTSLLIGANARQAGEYYLRVEPYAHSGCIGKRYTVRFDVQRAMGSVLLGTAAYPTPTSADDVDQAECIYLDERAGMLSGQQARARRTTAARRRALSVAIGHVRHEQVVFHCDNS